MNRDSDQVVKSVYVNYYVGIVSKGHTYAGIDASSG